jgi:hypothetical protein
MRNLLYLLFLLMLVSTSLCALNFEGFETGNLAYFPWSVGGYGQWTITSNQAQEGFYSARPGQLNHGEFSSLFISVNVVQPSPITFYWKARCEELSDYMRFKIDGAEVNMISGYSDWELVSFDLEEGYHTFEWTYDKDYQGSNYDDTVYLDSITFPQTTFLDYNLRLSGIQSSGISYQNDSIMLGVGVSNIGANTIDAYSVQVYKEDGEIVAEATIDDALQSGESRLLHMVWMVPEDHELGVEELFAEVICTNEQAPDDNTFGPHIINILGEGIVSRVIGTGTETTQWFPFNLHFNCSLAEVIYYPAELVYQGQIVGLGYRNDFSTTANNVPVKVWMGNTSQQNLTNGWIASSNLTEVFNDDVTFPAGSHSIVMDITPFDYTGGNLVIMTHRVYDTTTYSFAERFFYNSSTTSYDRARAVNSFNSINPGAPPDGYLFGWNPNTTIYFQLNDLNKVEGEVRDANTQTLLPAVLVQAPDFGKTTCTNNTGLYRVGNLDGATVTLTFTLDGYNEHQEIVSLPTNGMVNIDLVPKPVVEISGIVTGSDDPQVGIENAFVALTLDGGFIASKRTDYAGEFTFNQVLGNESYELSINAPGYQQYSAIIPVGTVNVDLQTLVLDETAVPPVEVIATQDSTGTVATVAWTPPPYLTRGFESYGVYRLLNSQMTNPDLWQLVATVYDDTMYVDPQWNFATPGVYRYAVTCIHSNNVESVASFSSELVKYDVNPVQEIVTSNPPVLLGNQPNPFNPETTISFTLGEYQDAISSCQIVIYNVRGQMVKNYDVNANSGSDILSVQWNGKDRNRRPVPSGIYLYQLVINGVPIDSRKMELMK